MKNLLFVSRVAFISNVCLLLSIVMRYIQIISDKDLQSTVIIAGFLLSFICNLIAAATVIILLLRKKRESIRPRWLFFVNFLCFIFQLYFVIR
jgi:hypothetical protein